MKISKTSTLTIFCYLWRDTHRSYHIEGRFLLQEISVFRATHYSKIVLIFVKKLNTMQCALSITHFSEADPLSVYNLYLPLFERYPDHKNVGNFPFEKAKGTLRRKLRGCQTRLIFPFLRTRYEIHFHLHFQREEIGKLPYREENRFEVKTVYIQNASLSDFSARIFASLGFTVYCNNTSPPPPNTHPYLK